MDKWERRMREVSSNRGMRGGVDEGWEGAME